MLAKNAKDSYNGKIEVDPNSMQVPMIATLLCPVKVYWISIYKKYDIVTRYPADPSREGIFGHAA